jgi:hypothetical protein
VSRERFLDAAFAAAGLGGLLLLPMLLRPAPAPTPEGLSPLAYLAIAQVVAVFGAFMWAARCSLRYESGNPARHSWLILAVGLLGLVLGEATEAAYEVTQPAFDPFPSIADVFFLLAYPALTVAFVAFRRAYRSSGFPVGSSRGAFAVGSVSLAVLVGLVALAPIARSEAPLLEQGITGAYVVFDLVALVAILLLLRMTWRFRGGGLFKVWAGILSGFLLTLAGDILFAYFQSRPQGIAGLDPDQLNALADVMFFLSYLAIARGTLHQLDLLGP